MVKLEREQQEMLMAAEPGMFAPAKGAWGLKGSTLVRLEAVDDATLLSAMEPDGIERLIEAVESKAAQ